MQNLLQDLVTLLEQDNRLTIEGQLLKNKVIELALGLDSGLIRLLLSHQEIKNHFFQDVDGILVFDKIKFQQFVGNKSFLPDSYTAFKNKIGLTADGRYMTDSKEVVLAWPYKDCVLEGGQTKDDAKRNEVFWNETLAPDQIDRLLAPKVLTNFKKYDKDGEHKVTNINCDDNLIIKGNNLLALHTLKQAYAGKVKLIYIDPPYNTDKDSFNYNDSFNHSSWLTFMKNRLIIAKHLLADNGVIIVQSNDIEQAYLKVLLDEIFGREQFETSFFIQVRFSQKTLSEDNDFQKVMEAAHVYSKKHNIFRPNKLKEEYSLNKFKYKITELSKGKEILVNGKKVEVFTDGQYEITEIVGNIDGLKETWATGSLIRQGGTAAEFLSKYLIQRKQEDGLKVLYKVYGMGDDGLGYRYISGPRKEEAFRGKFYTGVPSSIRHEVNEGVFSKEKPIPNLCYNYLSYEGDFGNCRTEGGVDIGGGKKPELLISYFIEYFTEEMDLVLDFYMGSGTTASVAHKMGRRYISMEQMDYIESIPVERLKKVLLGEQGGISKSVDWQGGGSFVYCELAMANQLFVDKIQDSNSREELATIWHEMQEKAFLSYRIDPRTIDLASVDFIALSLDDQKRFLIEVMDKNMLYVPASEIDDDAYGISDEDKKLNRQFFGEV